MAISIDYIYSRLQDLTRKDKAGYITNAEFNRNSKDAELVLWSYYAEIYDKSRTVPEGMRPFVVNGADDYSIQDEGDIIMPSDYGRLLSIRYGVVTSTGGATVTAYYPCLPLTETDLPQTLYSAVRGPSIAHKRFYHIITNDGIRVYPAIPYNVVDLRYLRLPTYGERAVTLDTANDQENIDDANTTDYEWPITEADNLLDVLLFFHGLTIRESEINNWISARKNIIAQSKQQLT